MTNPPPQTDDSNLNRVGDAAVFNHFERSGFLDHMSIDSRGQHKPEGNRVKYPHDLETNPEYGHFVHFDIYHKQNPSMETLVKKVKTVAVSLKDGVVDVAKGGLGAVGDALSGDVDAMVDSAVGGLKKLGGGASKIASKEDNEKLVADTRLGKANSLSKDKITLYMPGGLTNTDSLAYSEHDMGLLKGVLDGNLSAMIPGLVSKVAGLVDSAAEMIGQEVSAAPAINAITGSVRNPRKEQLFDGVGFRTFDFTFNFRPKNETEAYDMLTICKLFRFHAHPELNASQAYLLTPSEFQITFINMNKSLSENIWINKVGRCACTSVVVNYHPNDIVSTFENGIPTAVDLTISFTEMEAITRNHIYAGF